MALIGLRHCYATQITELKTDGSEPVYGAGFHVGRMMTADETVNFGDTPLYADDRMVNNFTDFTDGTLTVGVDEFGDRKTDMAEIRSKLTGETYTPASGDDPATVSLGEVRNETPVGIGFVKTGAAPDNGGSYFVLTWYYRVAFKPGSESTTTRGSSFSWQGQTLEGDIYTVPGMPSGKNIRKKLYFDTEEEALAKLKELAHYTEGAAEPASVPAEDTGASRRKSESIRKASPTRRRPERAVPVRLKNAERKEKHGKRYCNRRKEVYAVLLDRGIFPDRGGMRGNSDSIPELFRPKSTTRQRSSQNSRRSRKFSSTGKSSGEITR